MSMLFSRGGRYVESGSGTASQRGVLSSLEEQRGRLLQGALPNLLALRVAPR